MEKNFNRKAHWENIYQTKTPQEVSWYQPTPNTSLELLEAANITPEQHIIDIGGGDSLLVDNLLKKGFYFISVLDISKAALQKAKERLGEQAKHVHWIEADAANLELKEQYDCWHDRAAFHFLTDKLEIESYVNAAQQHLKKGGTLIIGTFSTEGPKKCSGIEIKQYNEAELVATFEPFFEKINCFTINHQTPFNTTQNFIFCVFKRK
ncbi:MAG TPA: class I SAM-dependent methyltransferase [Chitinophagales bacterium]|nr:class I SAM-dependent methyltransferase [Chitinophagales bacterium]HNM31715.1 class I SAM-dependent methyltransferase [Chitinophagales bacterium]